MSAELRSYQIFVGSDAAMTRQFYEDLKKCGPMGHVAFNLFRAQKTSTRAKRYRGGNGIQSYRSMAYDTKQFSLKELSKILSKHARELRIVWGWKVDPKVDTRVQWVLYVGLPAGQVSFHSPERHEGPDFEGDWDGKRVSTERILALCEQVLDEKKESSKQPTLGLELANA